MSGTGSVGRVNGNSVVSTHVLIGLVNEGVVFISLANRRFAVVGDDIAVNTCPRDKFQIR